MLYRCMHQLSLSFPMQSEIRMTYRLLLDKAQDDDEEQDDNEEERIDFQGFDTSPE